MHTIRLRDPWEFEPGQPAGGVWVRRFNWLAGEADGTVWLVLDPPPGAEVTVNGRAVAESAPGRYDVTPLVAPHNEVRVSSPAFTPDVRPFDARLEIAD